MSKAEELLARSDWREECRALQSLLLASGLDETVKWGKLCYAYEGNNVAIIFAMKACCAVGFFKGSLLKDDAGVLIAPGKHSQAMRQLRFDSLDEIMARAGCITAFVEKAIQAENDGIHVDFNEKHNLDYPEELLNALDGDPELADAFRQLTPGRRRGYVLHITDARQSETRIRRIGICRQKIISGKGLAER